MSHMSKDLENLTLEVNINVDDTRTYTTAHVIVSQAGAEFVGIGTSKRARGDKFQEPVGTSLAIARAFRDLAGDMERAALDHA